MRTVLRSIGASITLRCKDRGSCTDGSSTSFGSYDSESVYVEAEDDDEYDSVDLRAISEFEQAVMRIQSGLSSSDLPTMEETAQRWSNTRSTLWSYFSDDSEWSLADRLEYQLPGTCRVLNDPDLLKACDDNESIYGGSIPF